MIIIILLLIFRSHPREAIHMLYLKQVFTNANMKEPVRYLHIMYMSFPFLLDILKFDNTYSWTRTKEVRYSVQSLPPDPQMLEACIHSPTHSLASNGDTSGTMVGTTVEDKDEGSIENGVGGMSLEETVDEINH